MANEPNTDALKAPQAEADRLWILLYKGQLASDGSAGSSEAGRRTLVVRDADRVLISIPVGRGSALAVPLRVDELPCSGARLVVRLASETTPCPRCIDDHMTAACKDQGGLDVQGILTTIRAAIDRCAALLKADPDHGADEPAGDPPSVAGARITPRSGVLRLVPQNAPHVDAGGVPGDVDMLLIR